MAEKVEQLITGRPNSYVPARTLERLLAVQAGTPTQLFLLNMAMHYGQGAAAGGIRALMTWNGIRGPFADFMFIGIRLLIDQTLENWTGVGALPWSVDSVVRTWVRFADTAVGRGRSENKSSIFSTRRCLLLRQDISSTNGFSSGLTVLSSC